MGLIARRAPPCKTYDGGLRFKIALAQHLALLRDTSQALA